MEQNSEKIAIKVSVYAIVGNIILSVFKFVAGIVSNSSAMVSDAIHSASDVFSTVVVIIGMKMAAKESDREHPYGHERMECVAALFLSVILFITGAAIGIKALGAILQGNYAHIPVPGVLALAAAVISIGGKEAMFWYTRFYAKKLDSGALMADAWHHRSDALSSVGALIGIAGARMGYTNKDSVASLMIFFFIGKAAYDICKDAIDKMLDSACDEETEQQIRECAMAHKGVLQIDVLRTRKFGNKIYVDIEIGIEKEYTLQEAHVIAETVHHSIEEQFPKVKHIMVHVNPV